jgi:hypothetical protein
MDLKQTQVTDQNRSQFYRNVYPHQAESKSQLIDIGAIDVSNIIPIDCCGWHYKAMFPEKIVLPIDPIKTALEFKLSKDKVHKLVDNQVDHILIWPKFFVEDCAVIFDRSPILKYLTIDQLITLFNNVQQTYQPRFLIARLKLMFIDSDRLTDRFYDLSTIQVSNTVVDQFHYDANRDYLYMCFRKKLNYYDYSN